MNQSWARGVQWEFTRINYPNYSSVITYNFGEYTGVVEDLIDGISGYDQVSGYTLTQIEQALKGAKTFNDWRDNLKNLYYNGTENQVDALFSYWD